MTKPASTEIAGIDQYNFMAVVGKRVIHPGGRASSESLLRCAEITASSRAVLMPRTARVVPDLGYIVVASPKPR
jgi:hypothetical protein